MIDAALWRFSHAARERIFWKRLKARLVNSQELAMTKIILVSIALASLSTAALADARTAGHRTHHSHLVMGTALSPAVLNANASLSGDVSDHAMHTRNLRDSGYKPKDDFDSYGNVWVGN
ncbi:hypothetical protein ACE10Z_39465 [Bradyrhizobium sp. Pha-3]|uniref:hypothetical protein n=1 Tax=Bradyrhizobium sp. Pha-3 TaxID=208375 RepID=UPI0035D5101C